QDLFAVPLRHLVEPSPGKSRAIATALEIAQGEVIAFTDDDVDVDPSWIDTIRAVMSDPGIALAGGPVTPRWETPPPSWLRAAAFRAVYWAVVRVGHRVGGSRMRAGYSMSWLYWSAITHATLEAGGGLQQAIFGVPRHFVRRMLTAGARSVGAALAGRSSRM